MRYDDILQEVGQIGPYQVRAFLLLMVPLVIVAASVMSSVFTLTEPSYRCAIPGLANDTYNIQSEYHYDLVEAAMGSTRDCNVYTHFNISSPFRGNVSREDNTTQKCHRWVYDKKDFSSSIITEHRQKTDYPHLLVLERCDLYLVILHAYNHLCHHCTMFSGHVLPDVWHCHLNIDGARRSKMADNDGCRPVGAEFAWVAGEFLVLPLAYFTHQWRTLHLALGVGSLLAVLAVYYTPESPRWLLDKGKIWQARAVIENIAASNKKTLPKDAITKDINEDGPSAKVWEMFKYRHLVIRTFIIFYNWFCVNLMYYGLSLNLDNLPGDPYINFLIGTLVELLAYVITFFILDRLGRKNVHTAAMFGGGVACIVVIFPVLYLPSEHSWVVTALAMLGKTASSICYATLYIMTSELFPTVVRNSGLAFCSIFENTAAMASPYIADLGKLVGGHLSQALPMLVFGTSALVAGLASTQLPETLGRDLPETVEDALNYDGIIVRTEERQKAEDPSRHSQKTKM